MKPNLQRSIEKADATMRRISNRIQSAGSSDAPLESVNYVMALTALCASETAVEDPYEVKRIMSSHFRGFKVSSDRREEGRAQSRLPSPRLAIWWYLSQTNPADAAAWLKATETESAIDGTQPEKSAIVERKEKPLPRPRQFIRRSQQKPVRVGDKFHWLTVESEAPSKPKAGKQWHVRCKCGQKRIVSDSKLRANRLKSCGCRQHLGRENQFPPPKPGERFERLVLENKPPVYTTSGSRKYRLFSCRCDCGNTTLATADQLRHATKKSCGCLQRGHGMMMPVHNLTTTSTGEVDAIPHDTTNQEIVC